MNLSYEKPESEEAVTIDALPFADDVSKKYVPEGWESAEAFLKNMREEFEDDLQADYDNRLEVLDDKKFTAGEQWAQEVLDSRKGLPCLTINQIPQFTAQLVGDWRQNRNSIRVIPDDDGTVEQAEVRGDLIRSIEVASRADRVYDTSFESMVQCGDGAFRVSVEYARDDVFDQDIFLRPIDDCLSVVWDRQSIDPTGRDARRCFVEDTVPLKELERKWKDTEFSDLGSSALSSLRQHGWCDNKTAKVVEYWEMIERDRLLGLFQDGSIHVIDSEAIEDVLLAHGQPVKTRVSPCLYARMHLVTGWKILAGPYEYKLNRLPVVRMTGRVVNVGGKRIRHGLVRFMKDPARLRNFWRSIAAEQLGYAPKAQWIGPESAFAGREDAFRRAHLTRDPVLIYNDDASAPPERLNPPVPQMALLNEAQINTQDMKDVTGIHDASLGIKSNETSGRAIMARQREGDVASITYYDNGNAAILEAGDVINQLIPQIYDATRIVRTIGEDEETKLVSLNDPMDPDSPNLAVGQYDVQLTTGASYTTKRAEAADAMMQAIQVWPEIMTIAGDLVVKAQDWPGAQELSSRIQKTINPALLSEEDQKKLGPQQPQIDPAQIQQVMEQFQQLQEENKSLKMDRSLEIEKLEIDMYNAETQRIRALSDNMVDATKLNQDAIAEVLADTREREAMEAASAEGPAQSPTESE